MLLATTNQICQNLASVPLLWVLPLTLYLLSFVLCFSGDRGYSRRAWSWVLAIGTASVCHVLYAGTHQFRFELAIYSLALLACCMVCHGEAVRLRRCPEDRWRLSGGSGSFYAARSSSEGVFLPKAASNIHRSREPMIPRKFDSVMREAAAPPPHTILPSRHRPTRCARRRTPPCRL